LVVVVVVVCAMFWRLPIQGGNQNRDYIKKQIYSSVNQGIYGHMTGAGVVGQAPTILLGYV
jgi:hypothetical protein